MSNLISDLLYDTAAREKMIKHVFDYQDKVVIHIPVNFRRLMNHIQESYRVLVLYWLCFLNYK